MITIQMTEAAARSLYEMIKSLPCQDCPFHAECSGGENAGEISCKEWMVAIVAALVERNKNEDN